MRRDKRGNRRPPLAAPTQEKGEEQSERVVVAPAEKVTALPADSSPAYLIASTAPEAPTGVDLARWRSAASLSQRQAAAQVGVAHGTVAEAELAVEKALGEQRNWALREAQRG